MRNLIYLLVAVTILLNSCSAEQIIDLTQFQKHQKEQHEFMLSEDSPLEKIDKKNFVGLNYFIQDTSFVFSAKYNLYAYTF